MVPVRFGTSRVPAYREPGTVEAPFQYVHLFAYLFGTVPVRGTQVQSHGPLVEPYLSQSGPDHVSVPHVCVPVPYQPTRGTYRCAPCRSSQFGTVHPYTPAYQ